MNIGHVFTAIFAFALIAGLVFMVYKPRPEIQNPDGVFWMDSLVCMDAGCTMTLRNDSNDRIEVLVRRETATFIGNSLE